MERTTVYRNVAKLSGVELFYCDTRTQGPAILCLHGRWGRAETWSDFIQHYGKRYRIIAPDQRGHGLSGKPVSKYTAEEMAADAVELLDFLKVSPVILVGHSMGGRIAGYLAAEHPSCVRALAILDKSAAGPEKPCTLPLDQIPPVDPLTKEWPLPFISLSEARDYLRAATGSELACQYFMNSLVETVDGYRMMFSPGAMAANIAYEQSWFHLLPSIECPVLLVRSASHEAVTDVDLARMQSLIPDCLAREVSHPDHNVHLASKEEFYGYFDEFLRSLSPLP